MHAFCLLLTRSLAFSREIRQLICDPTETLRLHPQTYSCNGETCRDSVEYVKEMCMRQSGVFGTDREKTVYNSLTHLRVVVFVSDSNRWIVFEGSENFQSLGQIFLFKENNHF